MIQESQIKKTLFFDIETTTRYKTYEEYKEKEPNPAKDFMNQVRMKLEWDSKEIDWVYEDRGMLSPEHGQIVSIAYRIWDPEAGKFKGEVLGWDDKWKEKYLLFRFNEILWEEFGNKRGTLGGYNIKTFDIPYVYRRMLSNGIYPQPSLVTATIKPWDINALDLKDWWNGTGASGWSGFSSACEMMGVRSSKEEGVDGRSVGKIFWEDKDMVSINEYCMRDVEATIKLSYALSEERLKKRWIETGKELIGGVENEVD